MSRPPSRLVVALVVVVASLCTVSSVQGQTVDNVDTAFERTRTLAFEGKYDRAIALAQSILDEAPQYHGVRIFLGRMHAWNGRYAEADTALRRVLAADPDHKRAWQARIEVARWGENYEQALAFTAAALQRVATAEAFYLEQARVHLALDAPRKAGLAVDEAERLNPTHPDIAALRRQIQTGRLRYTLTLAGTHDRFSELFDAWTQGYAQLTRQTPLGSVIGRVNVASRFGSSGIQTQLDWYPSIADGIYGYLNVGVSGSALYPSFRFGAEPYVGLPRALEASAGLRYLNFDGSRVLIFTGSLSKYYGNWLFTARTFLTPSEVGVSNSYTLRARRYIAGSRHYVQLQSGFGFSPEERRFQAQPGTLVLLRSQSIAFSYNRPLAYNLLVFGSVGVSREERQIVDGSLLITTVNAGISYRF